MRIDIFKNQELFKNLEKYNKDIVEVWDKVGGSGNSWWFPPENMKNLHVRVRNCDLVLGIVSSYYELLIHPANYMTLFLIDLLYKDKKDVFIEDICCGMARLAYYLSKLGYSNFNLIDDFSQLRKILLTELMVKGGIDYSLNWMEASPKICNFSCYPHYPKSNIPDSIELFIVYYNETLYENLYDNLLPKTDLVQLCYDKNGFQTAFCKKDKLEEFSKKLEPFKIREWKS